MPAAVAMAQRASVTRDASLFNAEVLPEARRAVVSFGVTLINAYQVWLKNVLMMFYQGGACGRLSRRSGFALS